MKINIVICVVFCCFALFQIGMADNKAQDSTQRIYQQSVNASNVVLTLSITNKCIAGDAIYVRVTLKNQSDREIYYIRGLRCCYDSLAIEVFNSKGGSVSASSFGKEIFVGFMPRDSFRSRGKIIIAPGEEISMDVNLAMLFDLTVSGKYLLSIEAPLCRKSDIIPSTPIKVDKMHFEVFSSPSQAPYLIEQHLKNYGKGSALGP